MRDHVYIYIYTHGVQNEDSDGLLRLADAQLEVGAQDILLGHLEMNAQCTCNERTPCAQHAQN